MATKGLDKLISECNASSLHRHIQETLYPDISMDSNSETSRKFDEYCKGLQMSGRLSDADEKYPDDQNNSNENDSI